MTRLSDSEIEARLADLAGWQVVDGMLHREFRFRNFGQAMGFMVAAAVDAEKMNHHPNWSNVYNRVVVDIVSHDEGGISEKCFALAEAMNQAAPSDGV